jgi:ABC-type bacteriocin/lantibiotic exporter with double-glycine peptidase domain
VERALMRRRVPHVEQDHVTECGAACLAMVLAHHGKVLRLAEVREAMGVGRDGVSARRIMETAHGYGLRGRGVKVEEPERDLEYLDGPAILHWEFNHFVVYERHDTDGVEILDPARGRRRVDWSELRRAFTGAALTFEPTPAFEVQKGRGSRVLRQAWETLRGGPGLMRIVALSLLLQLLALALPVLMGLVVDRVIPRHDDGLLVTLALGLATMTVFFGLSTMVRSHLLLEVRTRLDARMTLGFLEHLVDLPYTFFQSHTRGDLINRLSSNSQIREILTSTAISTALDGVLVFLYLAGLFVAAPVLGVVVLGLGALEVLLFAATRRRERDVLSKVLDSQVKSQNSLMEILTGIETLKASGTERRALDHWSDLYVDELNVNLERGRLEALTGALGGSLRMAAPIVVLLFGTWRVLDGELSMGGMLAANALAVAFLTPLSTLVANLSRFQLLGTYLRRINDVLETPVEQKPGQGADPGRLGGRIELEQVSFRHSPHAPLVVRDVSAAIAPGSFVAIVGRSGSGKSTLARLLIGLYRPAAGRILYDGVDLAQLDLRALRGQVGVVAQNPYLFGQSIRHNIALGNPELSLDRVVQSARTAAIHDDILAMPMGYETPLADGGSSISGGQRQRIALARALANDPSILLLDEATSALDAVTEHKVLDGLEGLGCTRIVIAHRISTVAHADLILVMDDGALVEAGRHADLLAARGKYAELVAAQLASGSGDAPTVRAACGSSAA